MEEARHNVGCCGLWELGVVMEISPSKFVLIFFPVDRSYVTVTAQYVEQLSANVTTFS